MEHFLQLLGFASGANKATHVFHTYAFVQQLNAVAAQTLSVQKDGLQQSAVNMGVEVARATV